MWYSELKVVVITDNRMMPCLLLNTITFLPGMDVCISATPPGRMLRCRGILPAAFAGWEMPCESFEVRYYTIVSKCMYLSVYIQVCMYVCMYLLMYEWCMYVYCVPKKNSHLRYMFLYIHTYIHTYIYVYSFIHTVHTFMLVIHMTCISVTNLCRRL